MTEIKKYLASDTSETTATLAVALEFGRRNKLVEVRLEGSILSEHTPALLDFLKNVSYFPGNRWVLQLGNLEVMSIRALRVLVKFAKVIRRRGYMVEIACIRSTMLATLLDLKLHEYFGWEMIKRSKNEFKVSSREVNLFISPYEDAIAEKLV